MRDGYTGRRAWGRPQNVAKRLTETILGIIGAFDFLCFFAGTFFAAFFFPIALRPADDLAFFGDSRFAAFGATFLATAFVFFATALFLAAFLTRPTTAAGFKQFGNNFAVPALFLHSFPSWFVGIAFAAIGIGALVPAAIMSIAAANLYTRNIYREFISNNPTDKQEAQMAKWVSLIVKLGALVFIIFIPTKFAIYLQLLGGIWIIQTLPAIMLGVYTRWFNDWALLVGWAAGTIAGTAMAIAVNLSPTYPLSLGGYTFPGYIALYTVILNLLVALVFTPVFNAINRSRAQIDATVAADYHI